MPSGILTAQEITDTTESKEVLVPDSRGGYKTLLFPRGYTMLVKDYIGTSDDLVSASSNEETSASNSESKSDTIADESKEVCVGKIEKPRGSVKR